MQAYSQWFFNEQGWVFVTALGAYFGWTIGLKAYFLIVPMVLIAVLGE